MTKFRNSYHFVPRAKNDADAKGRCLPVDPNQFGLRAGHESEGHAIYAEDAFSGRIKCTITLECPTIIGGQRDSDDEKTFSKVAPFLFAGMPAIPASSLKGMLSHIAESAARAPYRVLRDMNLTVAYSERDKKGKLYTIRHKVGNGRSAVVHSPNRQGKKLTSQIVSSHEYFDDTLRPLGIDRNGSIKRALVNPVESMFGFVAEAKEAQSNAGRNKVNSAAGKLRVSHACPSGAWKTKQFEEFFFEGDSDDIEPKESWKFYSDTLSSVKFILLKEQGEPMKKPIRQEDHIGKAEFLDDKNNPENYFEKVYEKLNSATPNFYFFESDVRGSQDKQDNFVSKEDFALLSHEQFFPQGAKFYLHNPDSVRPALGQPEKQPWKSKAKKDGKGVERKTAAAILNRGVNFDFHIDFDNLTQHELNILCFSLRPSERFRHKIGLGKALGLGSIKIDVTDLILVDRQARYTPDALFASDPRDFVSQDGAEKAREYAAAHSEWLLENDKSARMALLTLGETHNFDGRGVERDADVPVLWVPLTEEAYQSYLLGSERAESNSFQWFTNNDSRKGLRQKLKPISGDFIPTLETNFAPPKNDQKIAKTSASLALGAVEKDGQRNPAINKFSGKGTLTTRTDKNGVVMGTVHDADTGKKFYVPSGKLRDIGVTQSDQTFQVSFTSDAVDLPGRLPPVSAIRRL